MLYLVGLTKDLAADILSIALVSGTILMALQFQ